MQSGRPARIDWKSMDVNCPTIQHVRIPWRGTNAMTVDVEDYFQVSAFEPYVHRRSWDTMECRLAHNIEVVLSILDGATTKATFFVLGWVAERYPDSIRQIAAAGHEIASHGYEHTRVCNQTPAQFRDDITKTKRILEDVVGVKVNGYRAASYSINADNLWALEVLAEADYVYSSSIYPIRHDLYGMPNAPRAPFRLNENCVLELPISTLALFGQNIPCGGGGYFRLFPYSVSRWALQRYAREEKLPTIFYFHPWELDDGQPRIPRLGVRARLRHYLNLSRMERRLRRLLLDFRWGRLDETFGVT